MLGFNKRKLRGCFSHMSDELWMMEPKRLKSLLTFLETELGQMSDREIKASVRLAEMEMDLTQPDKPEVKDGVAHINIKGPIMKEVPLLFKVFGLDATSTEDVGRQLDMAMADDKVDAVMFDVDSPGGTMSGVFSLGEQIFEARQHKPVRAHASDLSASAALWLSAQTEEFTADHAAKVGSIGAFSVLVDSSEAADEAGLKVHVVSSGKHKGVGVPGAEITDEQLKVEQELIDEAANLFISAVARGREMSEKEVRALATGRVWFAAEAHELGLVDGVESAKEAHSRLAESPKEDKPDEASDESDDTPPEDGPPEETTEDAVRQNHRSTNMVDKVAGTPASDADFADVLERLQKAEARAEAAEKAAHEGREAKKADILRDYQAQGRVTPAMVDLIEDYAKDKSPEELTKFLETLPKATKEDPTDLPKNTQPNALSSDDSKVARMFGISEKSLAAADQVVSVTVDGKAILKDGRRVALKEVVE